MEFVEFVELVEKLFPAVAAALLLFVLIRIFSAPLRLAMKILCNTILGFGALWLVQLTAPWTGISLGVNLLNALIVGILGLPGLLLLILVQWVL